MIFPYKSPVFVDGKARPAPQIILTAPTAPLPEKVLPSFQPIPAAPTTTVYVLPGVTE